MPTQQAAGSAIQVAVLDYFVGERSEMLVGIAVFLVVVASAVWLFLSSHTAFAMAFMLIVVLFGGVMAAGLASLMIRDHASSRVLNDNLQTEQRTTAIASEEARIGVVLSKFRYYRFGAAVLGVVALAGLMFSGGGWVHGIAAGLLLVVVAPGVIDQSSERRAHIYLERLTTA